MSDELRERLAAYAHEAWSGWMRYMFGKGKFDIVEVEPGLGEQIWIMPSTQIQRWTRQMDTPYADLPEAEKESDREEAEKMLAIARPRDMPDSVRATMREALLYWRTGMEFDEERMHIDAALAWLDIIRTTNEQQT